MKDMRMGGPTTPSTIRSVGDFHTLESNRDDTFWESFAPRFSVVSACYAVRRYLPAFLASLDAQTAETSECELIFVVDGCPEDSGEVIRAWMRTTNYPVQLVHKANGGVASARNVGFALARGQWLTSPDPDDTLAPNYINEISSAIDEFPDITMFASRLTTLTEDGAPQEHPLDFRFHRGTQLIELENSPEWIHLSGGTTFWSREFLSRQGLSFDERLNTGSDADFNLRYLLQNGAQYVVVPNATYYYLKRADGSSIIGQAKHNYERYQATICASHQTILELAGTECPQWLGNALLYATAHLFRGNSRPGTPVYQLSSSQRRAIAAALRSNLRRIGEGTIRSFKLIYISLEIRSSWLSALSRLNTSPVVRRPYDNVRARHRASFYSSSPRTTYTVSTSSRKRPSWRRRTRAVKFLGETWCFEHIVWVNASVQERIKLTSKTPNWTFDLQGNALLERSILKKLGLRTPNVPRPARPSSPASAQQALDLPSAAEVEASSPLESLGISPLWVIDCPRTNSAQAVRLYDYVSSQRPDLNIWLLGDPVHGTGHEEDPSRKFLRRGTEDHRNAMQRCTIFITSDLEWEQNNRFPQRPLKRTWRTVFVPNTISPFIDARLSKRARFDAIIASSTYETDFLTGPDSSFDVDPCDVYTIGLPHQDHLLSGDRSSESDPHRLLIAIDAQHWGVNPSDTESMLDHWQRLLDDPRLDELRVEYGVRVGLTISAGFEDALSHLIVPDWIDRYDDREQLERAMKSRAVLLTDYSELAFDAAFAGSAIIYYQVDRKSVPLDALLTRPGSFDFEHYGLGPVTETHDAAVLALQRALQPDAFVPSRDTSFFYTADGQATRRLLTLLEQFDGVQHLPDERDAAPSTSVSVVVRCSGGKERLATTLASLNEQNVGSNYEAILVVDEHEALANPGLRQLAEDFVARHAPLAQFIRTSESHMFTEANLLDIARGEWICLVEAGSQFELGAGNEIARLASQRPDLLAVAAYPRNLAKNPFFARYDIARQGISPRGQRIVSLYDTPDAFAALGVCAFLRRDALTVDAPPTDFMLIGFWVALVRALDIGSDRLGILSDVVTTTEGVRARLTISARSVRARRRLIDDVIAVVQHCMARADPLRPVTVSLILWLSLEALRHLTDDLWDTEKASRSRRAAFASVFEGLPSLALSTNRWATRLTARYALTSLAGTRAEPWVATSAPGRARLLYQGHPIARLGEVPVTLMSTAVNYGAVDVEATFMKYSPDIDLVLLGPRRQVLRAIESIEDCAGVRDRYGQYVALTASYRRFRIPAVQGTASWKIAILNRNTGRAAPSLNVSQGIRSPFVEGAKWMKRFDSGVEVRFQGRQTLRVSSTPPARWRYSLASVRRLRRQGAAVWERLLTKSEKGVILISDRPRFGDDNGEALFRYIQEHRPDIRRRTWFVLDPEAPSYAELRRTGRIVHPGSSHHRALYLNAQLLLSSHVGDVYNNPFHGYPKTHFADVTDATFIWLQHGITMNNVDGVFSRFRRGHDGVVLGAQHELEYGSRPEFGLTPARLIASGFPRFDFLHDSGQTQQPIVLYMPTWRSWLAGERQTSGASMAQDGFVRDEYFEHQRAFLTDTRLGTALEKAGARLEMVLHPAMTPNVEHYRALASNHVRVHEPGSVRYRDMFARGSGMITDYSSVFFDFSYLGKPVVFDHHDESRFRAWHYGDGIFNYEDQAPGPITRSLDDLVSATCDMLSSSFQMKSQHVARLDRLFLHHDRRNSERVLEQAMEIDRQRRLGYPTSRR